VAAAAAQGSSVRVYAPSAAALLLPAADATGVKNRAVQQLDFELRGQLHTLLSSDAEMEAMLTADAHGSGSGSLSGPAAGGASASASISVPVVTDKPSDCESTEAAAAGAGAPPAPSGTAATATLQ
jgi:hypothetical protein